MPMSGNGETQIYHFKLRQCLSLSHRLILSYLFLFLVFLYLYIKEQGAEQRCVATTTFKGL